MSLIQFVIRVTFVTFCVAVLLSMFFPRYELIDTKYRLYKFNKITGERD